MSPQCQRFCCGQTVEASQRRRARTRRPLAVTLILVAARLALIAFLAQTVAAEAATESVQLTTSDGVDLRLTFYPAPEDCTATVLLVHDIGGDHASVRELAESLQQSGCSVAVPDLRAHGSSGGGRQGSGRGRLQRNDLFMITGTGGGAIRSQARIQGDLETVRNWLKQRTDKVNLNRFCVIGSGLGGTLAAVWTAADWGWQPNTRGPQGQEVNGLILISPIWAEQGISISAALNTRAMVDRRPAKPLLEQLPVMIIAGANDSQAERLFKTFQRARPANWFQRLATGDETKADSGRSGDTGPVIFVQLDTTLRADKLATLPGGTEQWCSWFLREKLDP